jgi:hypothetical protein
MDKFTIREIKKAQFYQERMRLWRGMRRGEQASKNREKLILSQPFAMI